VQVLYATTRYYTVLYSTVLYSTLLYATLRYSTLLYATLRYSTLLYATLRYSTLLYATLRKMVPLIEEMHLNPFMPTLAFPYNLIWILCASVICILSLLVCRSIKRILDRLGTRHINQIVIPYQVCIPFLHGRVN
jgi:hypothetical protein